MALGVPPATSELNANVEDLLVLGATGTFFIDDELDEQIGDANMAGFSR